jgi:signal transduction histidine kinase/ligand-binding sensor domain-containing protein
MFRKRILLGLLMVCCCSLSLPVFAQAKFAYTRFSVDDGSGLSSNTIYSIYQDKKGFIWLATINGLQRFDGTKFVTFGLNDLLMNSISQILEADQDGFWLNFGLTNEIGLFSPSSLSLKTYPIRPNRPLAPRSLLVLWKGLEGETYVLAQRSAILQFDSVENAFTEKNLRFKIPANWEVYNVFTDKVDRRYWFSSDSGLVVYDCASKQTWSKHFNPKNLRILADPRLNEENSEFYIDKHRRHWIFSWPVFAGGMQLKSCVDVNGKPLNDSAGLNGAFNGYYHIHKFFETENSLWMYGMNNLMYEDSLKQKFVNQRTDFLDNFGIRFETAYHMLKDRDGSIWIATDQGLYFLNTGSNNVSNLFFSTKNGQNNFVDILELKNGEFWLASWGRGVHTMTKKLEVYQNQLYDEMPAYHESVKAAFMMTWSLHQHSQSGKVYIGCQGGNLMIHDPVLKKTEFVRDSIFNFGSIRYINEDKNGNLWFGTQGGRLIKLSEGKFTVVQDFGTIIYKIFIDSENDVWACTHERGVYVVKATDGTLLSHFTAGKKETDLFANTAGDIEQYNDSIFFVSSSSLNIINKRSRKVRQLTMMDGLPSNSIRRLRLDKTGNLWLITMNGLCRFNYAKNKFSAFGKKDGFINPELVNEADYLCKEDYVMFTGKNNLLFFHPSAFASTEIPPDVTITDFRLFNIYYPVDSLNRLNEIKLNHSQNSFTLFFSSLSFLQQNRLIYYYKMEGIDKDWVMADNSYAVNYSLLPPGRYTFKVKCENNDGVASANITEMWFYIQPPFWRSSWFLALLALLLAALVYYMYRQRIHRLLEREKIRTRIARDLHDDMGSTLSTINILSEMAKKKIKSDSGKTEEYIYKISENSQRMMEVMDDIVWAIKPANDSMDRVVARMREFATGVLEAKEIEFDFKVEENVNHLRLDVESRRDFFLVFKEALNNLAKYSGTKWAEIRIYTERGKLKLNIKDFGKGFEIKGADNGNGLSNMQKRAQAIKGNLYINSAPGKGTSISLEIPVT